MILAGLRNSLILERISEYFGGVTTNYCITLHTILSREDDIKSTVLGE